MPYLICPTCKKQFDPEKSDAMPFCSKRCRLADLNGWFDERFSIPMDVEGELERRANDPNGLNDPNGPNDLSGGEEGRP